MPFAHAMLSTDHRLVGVGSYRFAAQLYQLVIEHGPAGAWREHMQQLMHQAGVLQPQNQSADPSHDQDQVQHIRRRLSAAASAQLPARSAADAGKSIGTGLPPPAQGNRRRPLFSRSVMPSLLAPAAVPPTQEASTVWYTSASAPAGSPTRPPGSADQPAASFATPSLTPSPAQPSLALSPSSATPSQRSASRSPRLGRLLLLRRHSSRQLLRSPDLQRKFVPKLYALSTWRPRLFAQLLPKYLLALDSACTLHLYRCALGTGFSQHETQRCYKQWCRCLAGVSLVEANARLALVMTEQNTFHPLWLSKACRCWELQHRWAPVL